MESVTAKKRFCSEKCRVYYNREKKGIIVFEEGKVEIRKPELIQVMDGLKSKPNEIPPIPVREPGEDPFDFAERKNAWKKKYNQ